jgi:hypothetical protein
MLRKMNLIVALLATFLVMATNASSQTKVCNCANSSLVGDSVGTRFVGWPLVNSTVNSGVELPNAGPTLGAPGPSPRWNINYGPDTIRVDFLEQPATYGMGSYFTFSSLDPQLAGCPPAFISGITVTTNKPSTQFNVVGAATFGPHTVTIQIAPSSKNLDWQPGEFVQVKLNFTCDKPSAPITGGLEKVLILFNQKTRHIDRVAALRDRIEQTGGRVRAVIGLAGVIADIERGSSADIAATKDVEIYNRTNAAPPSRDAETLAAVAAWNRISAGKPTATTPSQGGPPPGGPPSDVSTPPDLPRDPAQLRAIESEYRRHWQEVQRNLPPQLRRNLPSPMGKLPSLLGNLPFPMQRSNSLGCGTNGAGYFDTSLYFAGDIAVGVFYVNGSSGGWTQTGSASTASTAYTFADVVYALDQFLDIQPNARIVFTYVNEVDSAGNPLPTPPNERTYVNDLRNTRCTDWGFIASVQNGGVWPNAYLHGPSTRLDRTFSWFDPNVIRHEIGHVVGGAGDAYAPNGPAPRYGYLMAAHANACGNDGTGFFSGAGECLDDMMAGWGTNVGYNSIIGPYTAGQLGWHSSNGDGVLDVTRTKPVIDSASIVHVMSSASEATYSGVAFDRPLLTQLSFPYGSVSINRITAVQYRIDSAAWQDAAPADGIFDSVSESFNFTTPQLRNGTFTVEIRAINTIGAVTPIPYAEQITVTGSSISNTRPFGSLTVTPLRAKFGTTITASGAASRDLEPGSLQYSWKWGTLPWTTFSTSANATNAFPAPGIYTVQMRVRDVGGLIHPVSRTVTIEANDTAPVIAFTVTPENRHFTSNPNYSLSLRVVGSRDAETPYAQLQVQWDIDCDGWDGPPTLQKTKTALLVNTHYPRSDRRCVRAQIIDSAGNSTEAERFIWLVPYNHPPSVSGVTYAQSGLNYIATVNATDPDSATTWDGMLEYRYDFEGDGIWDTKFGSTSSIPLLAAYRYTLAVEVKDRFHARVVWYNWSGCYPYAC